MIPDEERLKALIREQEQLLLRRNGWYGHYVMDDPVTPFGVNYHTHGIQDRFKQPDLQVCLNVDPFLIRPLFRAVYRLMQSGEVIEAWKPYYNILKAGLPVLFIEAEEGDRMVLRMVLPDADGNFNTEPYCQQFKVD